MAPRTPPLKRIRASSRSTVPPVPLEDDDSDADEPALDQQLAMFVRRPPSAADRFIAIAQSSQGDQIVQDRSATELRATDSRAFANELASHCERWARVEGREVRFRGTWQAGDRVLGSYSWRAGNGDPLKLDGTVESMLIQMQRHIETRDRVALEERGMLKDGWSELLKLAYKRIGELEAHLAAANDRLKKAGDVDAEIAITTTAAQLEQRARLNDIVETRVLPIIQALAVRHLGSQPPAPAVATLQKEVAEQANREPPASSTRP